MFTQDAMDDSGAPGVSTPEHWSDVGPLSGRLQLVEQQVQTVQVGRDGGCCCSGIMYFWGREKGLGWEMLGFERMRKPRWGISIELGLRMGFYFRWFMKPTNPSAWH